MTAGSFLLFCAEKASLILNSNKKQTIFAVYFPQYFVVVLARRQSCGVLRLVLRKISSQIFVHFLSEISISGVTEITFAANKYDQIKTLDIINQFLYNNNEKRRLLVLLVLTTIKRRRSYRCSPPQSADVVIGAHRRKVQTVSNHGRKETALLPLFVIIRCM